MPTLNSVEIASLTSKAFYGAASRPKFIAVCVFEVFFFLCHQQCFSLLFFISSVMLSIKINPITPDDAGLYMCQVSTHPPRVFATNLTVLGETAT